ncbi:hypothetical protein EI42_04612 [Thermosporothrix hazakensis]|jgi:hypothetical protein|uniref:Uncharacterized protein n=2 Tax=Thermosporothrix TaxID=768650 RepID=A0A326U2G0_THEHA|nr:hypothetical protein [Thermosporothrix hazakensis]PZW24730.1 hypothetical protein EI42_04612 [Thermosporothrix hazakensis]BBH90286.1 hypothetical protein KTC_50370 [Thermosporothrix sp. COM3]GCE48323.1 hypothetical protein KTH_31920 [Thermosporothrix hazakensis]
MPKRHQQAPAKKLVGHNNPKKTTEITTGTPKKQETYEREAREHKDPGVIAQHEKPHPERVAHPGLTHKADSQERMEDRETRSGSESNATTPRKDERVHREHKGIKEPRGKGVSVDYSEDLLANNLAGEHHGMRDPSILDYGRTAMDIKELHTILADLSDDELKSLIPVGEGSRLEQGAKYIDLKHLERGEFVATANMIAEPGHIYVAKKDTDYVLWNRLNQVSNPERLDEASES